MKRIERPDALPSASGILARLAFARARARRVALPALLRKANLTRGQLEDRDARMPAHDQVRLAELVAAALGDDMLGFHLARDFELREAGLLYYVFASSDTLLDGARRVARYTALVNESVVLQCLEGTRFGVTLHYVGISRADARQQAEFWATWMARMFRALCERAPAPQRVKFVHFRKAVPEEFGSLLGSDIDFGAEIDCIAYSRATGKLPLVAADPHLNRLLVRFCEEALARRGKGPGAYRTRVENAIVPALPHGEASAARIAMKLGDSPRTLARRLREEGTTFTRVLDELRHRLARRYLAEHDLQVAQIAWLLGFQGASAFSKAFKRWTGHAPASQRAASP